MKIKVLCILLLTITIGLTFNSNSVFGETQLPKDVKQTDWYIPTVEKLIRLGGIKGYPDGTLNLVIPFKS